MSYFHRGPICLGNMMQSLRAETIGELKHALAPFGDDCLFRGQTKAFWDSDGAPLLNSSFERKGCIPPLMLKWSFFVRELLRRGGFDVTRPDEQNINQGLLQHYGWRSFFVDLTSSSAVAAWFGSHAFQSKHGWNLCENSSEQGVMLGVQRAQYTESTATANLYVLSKRALRTAGHTLIDLDGDLTTDCPTRYHAQRAWLASIFLRQHRLDPSVIVAHVTGPASVFREYAAESEIKDTGDVFPGPDEDKMLAQLLSLPYMRVAVPEVGIPFYARSLDIPEYHDSFVKHLPTSTVLAAPTWLSEGIVDAETGAWMRVQEETFYGSRDANVELPSVAALLKENPITHIETDGLICFPTVEGSRTYEKGICIRRDGAGLYEVGSLTVDYSSDILTGVGVSRGYRYSLSADDRLVRVISEDDCPCGDPERHRYHLQALAVLDDMLGRMKVERDGHIMKVGL